MYYIIKFFWVSCKGLIIILCGLFGFSAAIGGFAILIANPIAGVVILLVGFMFIGIASACKNKRDEQLRIEEWQRRQNEPWNYMD
jgi:hypothetical protein